MEINTENIQAYIEGNLSAADKATFEKELASSEELRRQVSDMKFVIDASAALYDKEKIDVDKRWKSLSASIDKANRFRLILRLAGRVAAILMLPLLISTIYLYQRTASLESSPIEIVQQTTAYGLISKIKLPDGSEVWLNSGSSLRYPERFTSEERQVYLSGEGYFKVSSDKEHRFDVALSNGLIVSAYGTEFNINSYNEDTDISIALAKGAIEVTNRNNALAKTLQPGEEALFNKNANTLEVSQANLYQITSWKDGKIVFRRTDMNEVCKKLSRHFNVDIELQNKEIYDYKYSATFTTETLEEILGLLEKTAPIKCRVIHPAQNIDYSYIKKRVVIERK